MASASRFSLVALPVGLARLVVDAGDGPSDVHPHVLAGSLQWAENAPTVLTLHLSGAGHIEGEGIVQVAAEDADVTAAVVDWLKAVDPDTLHHAAMSDPANDASRGIAHAHIAQLIRDAGGEP